MSPRKTRTVPIEKSDYITYLERARQYVASAKDELGKGRPESVGLLAIHCAIASADALVVYEKGFRSAGESHFDATEILRTLSVPDANKKAQLLTKIILQKNRAEYEERPFSSSDAHALMFLVDRFFLWVEDYLKTK